MDKEAPHSVATESGGEAEGNSHELCVEYTETSTPAPVKQGVISITAEDFLEDAFINRTDAEHICVSRSRWLSDGTGTYFQNYTTANRPWVRRKPGADAWYVCVGSVDGSMGASGKYVGRGRSKITRVHLIMLDDIFDKTDAPPVEPSVKIETSPGSFQWFYFLSEPCEDLPKFEALVSWITDAGWGDKGAGGAYRLCRVPGSRNIKKDPAKDGFISAVTEYYPDRQWTLDELATELGCDFRTLTKDTVSPSASGEKAEGGIDPFLAWLSDADEVIRDDGGEWVTVKCPWAAEHTTGSDTAGYSPLGRGEGQFVQLRSFRCQHEHCSKRRTKSFVEHHNAAGAPQVSAARTPAWVREKNEKYFVLREGATVSVGHFVPDETLNGMKLSRLTPSSFKTLEDNKAVNIGDEKKPNYKPAGSAWLKHSGRLTYPNGTCMTKGEAPLGALNLWRGFGVEPRAGDWSQYKQHLDEVICGGDPANIEYLMGWLANLVQNPFDPAGVAVVLQGGKGTGKGAFAEPLLQIFGQHGFNIASAGLLSGRFNAHLEGVCFLFADEAYFAGARADEGQLKSLITEKTYALEGKGRDAVMSLNRLSVLMATNSDHAVRASEDERRYFVVEVSDKHQRDQDYFTALWGEIGDDGPAAMLHDLLAYDLAGWAVQQVPQTKALANQKLLTLEGHVRWWYGELCEGSLQGASDGDWEANAVQVEKKHFYAQYLAFADRDRTTHSPLSNVQFYRKFRAMCAAVKETRPRAASTELQDNLTKAGARQLSIPNLATCRDEFEKFIGQELGWDE